MSRTWIAAIVKGIAEQASPEAYFSSFAGLAYHIAEARDAGLITLDGTSGCYELTARGAEWYQRALKGLPRRWAAGWPDFEGWECDKNGN